MSCRRRDLALTDCDTATADWSCNRTSEPGDDFYDAKLKVLSEEIKHHVKEEEARSEGMFTQAPAAGLDMDALGDKMAVRKKVLLTDFKAKGLPTPKTRSFTCHWLVQGEPATDL